MGNSWPLFRLFLSYPNDPIQILIDESINGVLGARTQAAGWKVPTNPLSYGAIPEVSSYNDARHHR